jgi:hypothetical protein
MDNPETLAVLGTQDHRTKTNKTKISTGNPAFNISLETLEPPVPSQGHYSFHSFPVVD